MQARGTYFLYTTTFGFSIVINMLILLIPFYLLSLGFTALQLGWLISLPGLCQMIFRLPGGMLIDRIGERAMLRIGLGFMALAVLLYATAESILAFAAAQVFFGTSRSIYYDSSQAYATRASTDPGAILGRIVGVLGVGNLLGFLGGGFLAEQLNYQTVFIIIAAVGLTTTAIGFTLPPVSRAKAAKKQINSSLAGVLRNRKLYMAGVAAFVGSLPLALLGSFYPVFYQSVGFNEKTVGILLAVCTIGVTVTGFLYARVARVFTKLVMITAGVFGTGVMIAYSTYVLTPWAVALILFALGGMSGLNNVLYQATTAESEKEQLGLAMSFTGLFWGAANFVVPAFFGVLVTLLGLAEAFRWSGGFLVGVSLLLPYLIRRLLDEQGTEKHPVHEPSQ